MRVSVFAAHYFPVNTTQGKQIQEMPLEYLQNSGYAPYVSLKSCPGHVWHRNML